MKVSLLYIVLVLLLTQTAHGQTLNLTTQAEVDAFDPMLSKIPEGMIVNIGQAASSKTIFNIDALTNITKIEGELNITHNTKLKDINGLRNVTDISGSVLIKMNELLHDIDALQNLNTLTGKLDIVNNKRLQNIDGFQNLDALMGELYLVSNRALKNIDGMSNITMISGHLYIGHCDSLKNLDALSKLRTLDGNLWLYSNKSLSNIDSMKSLQIIGGNLRIIDNPSLTNIDGLSNLTDIYGGFQLENNDNLTDISALTKLKKLDGSLIIVGNESLESLQGLNNIKYINKLKIQGNSNLLNLDGLTNVKRINQQLAILNNDALRNINGLKNLSEISTNAVLRIQGNKVLMNVDGLTNLSNISGLLSIAYNSNLEHLNGLSSLQDLVGEVKIIANASLKHIDGLSNLRSIKGLLHIWKNALMTNLDGLCELETITGTLDIQFNRELTDCCGISHLLPEYESQILLNNNPANCTNLGQVQENCKQLSVVIETSMTCPDMDNGRIQVSATNGQTNIYQWNIKNIDTGAVTSGSNSSGSFVIDDLPTGMYSLYLYAGEKAVYENQSIEIREVSKPEITYSITPPECEERTGSVATAVAGGIAPFSYWLNNAKDQDGKFELIGGEQYTIRIQDNNGCRYDTLITLEKSIPFTVEGPKEIVINKNENVTIEITTDIKEDRIDTILWEPAINCDDCLSPTLNNVENDIRYTIKIIDINGCMKEDHVDIRIKRNQVIFVPNTMHLDSGINGSFYPYSGSNILVKDMKIFDRWGTNVFHNTDFKANDPKEGWNGYRQNSPVERGVYTYAITYIYENEASTIYGTVLLLK